MFVESVDAIFSVSILLETANKLARRNVITTIQGDKDMSVTAAPANNLKIKPRAMMIMSTRKTFFNINE